MHAGLIGNRFPERHFLGHDSGNLRSGERLRQQTELGDCILRLGRSQSGINGRIELGDDAGWRRRRRHHDKPQRGRIIGEAEFA